MTPIHPGEILKTEFMEPQKFSGRHIARALGMPPNCVTEIIRGRRGITANTALRLSRVFDTTPEFWMNLQSLYELEVARGAGQ